MVISISLTRSRSWSYSVDGFKAVVESAVVVVHGRGRGRAVESFAVIMLLKVMLAECFGFRP